MRDGTWTFDGEVVRIVPGRDRKVHKLRQATGELSVPLDTASDVESVPIVGFGNGYLRFRVSGASALKPRHDPNCITGAFSAREERRPCWPRPSPPGCRIRTGRPQPPVHSGKPILNPASPRQDGGQSPRGRTG